MADDKNELDELITRVMDDDFEPEEEEEVEEEVVEEL